MHDNVDAWVTLFLASDHILINVNINMCIYLM